MVGLVGYITAKAAAILAAIVRAGQKKESRHFGGSFSMQKKRRKSKNVQQNKTNFYTY